MIQLHDAVGHNVPMGCAVLTDDRQVGIVVAAFADGTVVVQTATGQYRKSLMQVVYVARVALRR